MKFKIRDCVKVEREIEPKEFWGYIDEIDVSDTRPYAVTNFKTNCGHWCSESELTLHTEKNWDTLQVGDILVNGEKAKVLAVMGEVILRSSRDDFVNANDWYTKTEAQKDGWKIKDATDDDIEIVVEGKTKKISRKSAEELNLI